MSNLAKAIEIASSAHVDAFDRGAMPYILHPLRVMGLVNSDDEKMVAALHDVVEDTDITLEDLSQEGFSDKVVKAVGLLTHRKEQISYMEYVIALKGDPLAVSVKMADLQDNTRIDRQMSSFKHIDKDVRRVTKYYLTWQYLNERINEEEYRELMTANDNARLTKSKNNDKNPL